MVKVLNKQPYINRRQHLKTWLTSNILILSKKAVVCNSALVSKSHMMNSVHSYVMAPAKIKVYKHMIG
jgi:hypothetical protein